MAPVLITRAEAAREALRWVTDAAMPAPGGATWPEFRRPGGGAGDDLYVGTAGVLMALAEARMSGIRSFDAAAAAAVSRLTYLGGLGVTGAIPGEEPANPPPDPRQAELYTGLSGYPVALRAWAQVTGDQAAAAAAAQIMDWVAGLIQPGLPASGFRDLIIGEAGILLALVTMGGPGAAQAAGWIADRLVAAAQWPETGPDGEPDGGPDWTATDQIANTMPNFSHGAAGIGFVLATAAGPLGQPDLLGLAVAGGRRLERLGRRPDGTLTVPHSIPQHPMADPVSYGWCHGPAGTSRFFALLDQLQPGEGWADCAAAGRAAIRASGLPARLHPGFWDNLGQCCGTAGVGEMALDHYQDSGDTDWLDFADALAADVLSRAIADGDGVRWSHTEHRATPPELEPAVGWMQGAAGIAGWLLRLDRVHRDGPAAPRLWWPDRPPVSGLVGHDDEV